MSLAGGLKRGLHKTTTTTTTTTKKPKINKQKTRRPRRNRRGKLLLYSSPQSPVTLIAKLLSLALAFKPNLRPHSFGRRGSAREVIEANLETIAIWLPTQPVAGSAELSLFRTSWPADGKQKLKRTEAR